MPKRANASTHIVIDGIPIELTRKSIKNMNMRINLRKGTIAVSAPQRASDAAVHAFIHQHIPWARAQLSQLSQCQRQIVAQYRAILDANPVLQGQAEWNSEAQKLAAERIQSQLPALLNKWQPIIGKAPSHITLRTMTSRWGSCTPKTARIRLNLQLGLMPPELLEYVLVHEMTHLWERGHGVGFQRRMDSYLPNWKQLRKEINQYGVLQKAE